VQKYHEQYYSKQIQEVMLPNHKNIQCTSLMLQTCPAAHEDGRSSSGGIACQGMMAVYPGSTTVLPVQVKISPPTSNITLVSRYRQSALTCDIKNPIQVCLGVFHDRLKEQSTN